MANHLYQGDLPDGLDLGPEVAIDCETMIERLNKVGVPAGPILNMAEVFAHPQVNALPTTATVEHPSLGSIEILGIPVQLSRTPGAVRCAAPDPGIQTEAILGELGYTQKEQAALKSDGVV